MAEDEAQDAARGGSDDPGCCGLGAVVVGDDHAR
jgi:hypothetical protein